MAMINKEVSENADRLSCLPVPILHHVLSFLPIDDIVRTGVLSKAWTYVWCSVPTLDFDWGNLPPNFDREELGFLKYVEPVIVVRDGSNVHKFRAFPECAYGNNIFGVNAWIVYAVKHKVQVLDIATICLAQSKTFELPPDVFTCESLRKFKLSCNAFKLPASIRLPALRTLHFRNVAEVDDAFFPSIPSLEVLVLDGCSFKDMKTLTIAARQLKTLRMVGKLPKSIQISAPTLKSLTVRTTGSVATEFKVRDSAVCLFDAVLDINPNSFATVVELFRILRRVQHLTLCALLFSSISKELLKDKSILRRNDVRLSSLDWLKIETRFDHGEMMLVKDLLKYSSRLETMIIVNKMGKYNSDTTAEQFEADEVRLPKLKLVEIHDFRSRDCELELVECFLKRGRVLEKLVIKIAKYCKMSSMANRKLPSFPRICRKPFIYQRTDDEISYVKTL